MSEILLEQEAHSPKEVLQQWLTTLNFIVQKLKDEKPKNELEYVTGIQLLLSIMKKSVEEWIKWAFPSSSSFDLNHVIAEMDKEILVKTFEGMRELVIKWIEFDKEITSIVADIYKDSNVLETEFVTGQFKKEDRHYI